MPRRYILHVDVDAFFASVEEILDPSLKGKPLSLDEAFPSTALRDDLR